MDHFTNYIWGNNKRLIILKKIIDAFKEEDKIGLAVVEKLKELGVYERYSEKQEAETKVLKTKDLIKLKQSLRETSAVTFPDPADFLADIDVRIEQLDIKKEEDQDQNIRKVKQWLQTGKIRTFNMQRAN